MFRRVLSALTVTAAALAFTLTGGFFGTPAAATASPKDGTLKGTYTVKAGYVDTFTVTLLAKEQTRIRVSGDGDTKLELRVYDENNNLIDSDTAGSGDTRVCYVNPKWTGKFYVKVTNPGHVGNVYTIIMD